MTIGLPAGVSAGWRGQQLGRRAARIRRAASRRGRCAGGSTTRGRTGPTATSGSPRSDALLRWSPASTPRPPAVDRAAIRGCRTPPRNRRPGGRAAGRRGPSAQVPRRAQVLAQLAVGAVDPRAQRGVAAPARRSARARIPPAPRPDCDSRPGNASGSRSRNSLMMCGFQAHHRFRDSSVSWLLSFSPVVIGRRHYHVCRGSSPAGKCGYSCAAHRWTDNNASSRW